MGQASGSARVRLAFLAASLFALAAVIEAFVRGPMFYIALIQAGVAALWFVVAFRWKRESER